MKINAIICEEIKNNNNIIATEQVLALGFSRTTLSNAIILNQNCIGLESSPGRLHLEMKFAVIILKELFATYCVPVVDWMKNW